MAKRIIEGIEVEAGSGNVLADLGPPNADKLKIKSGLVIEITSALRTPVIRAAAPSLQDSTRPCPANESA